jgi:hypothetical protein
MDATTALSSNLLAIAALVTALGTFIVQIFTLVNSFRNTKKIDATHDIAVTTMQQTQRVYLPTAKKDE